MLSGASREAAHVFCEPGVEVSWNQLPGFVLISRLGSPLGPLGLDLMLHLSPGLCPQSWFVNLSVKQTLKLRTCSRRRFNWFVGRGAKRYLSGWSYRTNVVSFSACDVGVFLPWSIQSKRMATLLNVLSGRLERRRPHALRAPSLFRGFGGFCLLRLGSSCDCKVKYEYKPTVVLYKSDIFIWFKIVSIQMLPWGIWDFFFYVLNLSLIFASGSRKKKLLQLCTVASSYLIPSLFESWGDQLRLVLKLKLFLIFAQMFGAQQL